MSAGEAGSKSNTDESQAADGVASNSAQHNGGDDQHALATDLVPVADPEMMANESAESEFDISPDMAPACP